MEVKSIIMLQTEFKRDMHNNYMVMKKANGILENSYCLNMLLNNSIPGLLKLELRVIDNSNEYYYEVTAKQPIYLLFEKGQLNREQIKKLMKGIIYGINKGREFLLKENDFVLDPQYIYISLSSFEVSLCYVVGFNMDIRKQLCEVIEFLMNKVDHRDEEAVLLIYGLYKLTREETCTFQKLEEILEKKDIKDGQREGGKITEYHKQEELPCSKEEKTIKGPKILERVESEKEKLYYPKKTLVYCGLSAAVTIFIIYFFAKIGEFHYGKMVGILIIAIAAELYFLSRILSRSHMEAKLECNIEYIEPKKKAEVLFQSKEIISSEIENSEQTMVLSDMEVHESYKLYPEDNKTYKEIPLIEFPFFVGKLKVNVDYSIENKAVSRFHAKLEKEGDNFYITDLNSTNGTFLNEIRIEANTRRILHLGDEISFANIKYRFAYS